MSCKLPWLCVLNLFRKSFQEVTVVRRAAEAAMIALLQCGSNLYCVFGVTPDLSSALIGGNPRNCFDDRLKFSSVAKRPPRMTSELLAFTTAQAASEASRMSRATSIREEVLHTTGGFGVKLKTARCLQKCLPILLQMG